MTKTIWMLTFESEPLVKIGGLGEVPPSLARELTRRKHRVYILMPSHGLLSTGKIKRKYKVDEVNVGLYRWDNVDFIVLGGGVLEDKEVYSQRILEKSIEYAKALTKTAKSLDKLGISEPCIIHAHDWHSVLGLLALKTYYEDIGLDVKYVYHIHLTVSQTLSRKDIARAGISLDKEHRILLHGEHRKVTVEEALELSRGLADRLGAIEADRLVTVSKSYLYDENRGVKGRVGEDVLFKARVVYNGTDWRYNKILGEVLRKHGEKIKEYMGVENKPTRTILRKYLLLRALGELGGNEPIIPDNEARKYIHERVKPPFYPDARVEAFYDDGPLVLNSGRISKQKGIDVLAEAVPRILRRIGNARFLLFELPVWGEREYIDQLIELAHNYPDNVRVIFGYAPSIYQLAYMAGDIYVAPSRWEPFGITALEAMVTGNPVVASSVGGFTETILDIRVHGPKGTGILVEPEDPYVLADMIADMILLMMSAESKNPWKYIDKIEDDKLRRIVEANPRVAKKIRGSCIHRVESSFTWAKSAEQLIRVYNELYEEIR